MNMLVATTDRSTPSFRVPESPALQVGGCPVGTTSASLSAFYTTGVNRSEEKDAFPNLLCTTTSPFADTCLSFFHRGTIGKNEHP